MIAEPGRMHSSAALHVVEYREDVRAECALKLA
jgi:hypothetical protein